MRRSVRDLFGQFTRPVQIFDHQSAILAGGLNGDIAHTEDSLPNRLKNPDVLNLGKLDDPNRFGGKSSFVAHLVTGDRQSDGLTAKMPFDGPKQHQQARDRKVRPRVLIGDVFVVHDDRGTHHQEGANITQFDEFHAGADHGIGHRMLDELYQRRLV